MALVKFGGGITEMRGSIAGNVYARNRSGAYARARTKPVNPNTEHQVTVRSIISNLAERWAAILTAAQRTAWNLYAANLEMMNKLGEVIYLTGFNHYIRSNAARMRAGLAIVDDGPVIFELPTKDESFAVTISEATQLISVAFDDTDPWCDEDGAALIVHQGMPQSAQVGFFGGPFRYAGVIEGDSVAPPTTPQTIACEFVSTEDQHIWCQTRICRADGRLSEMFRDDTFCAA